jgi:hypothetical protein
MYTNAYPALPRRATIVSRFALEFMEGESSHVPAAESIEITPYPLEDNRTHFDNGWLSGVLSTRGNPHESSLTFFAEVPQIFINPNLTSSFSGR